MRQHEEVIRSNKGEIKIPTVEVRRGKVKNLKIK